MSKNSKQEKEESFNTNNLSDNNNNISNSQNQSLNLNNNNKQNFKILNSESDASANNNILKSNKIFLEKGVDSSFKNLTTNLFSTINSTFANFNNDFDKKVNLLKTNKNLFFYLK